MSERTLYNKIWNAHRVSTLDNGLDQLVIGLHFIHEVTTPQAFASLKERGAKMAFPHRTFATMDHIVPTDSQARPFSDPQAEKMAVALEKNVAEFGLQLFDFESGKQGIVHVVGPELGLTQPGMTIVCGDSHTSTHGAFGSLAFGIGTTEVRNVLETQSLSLAPLKVRRIQVDGVLGEGVYAKDVILAIIAQLGVKGGIGYVYEYAGEVFDAMSMEDRMTVCNMSIEGGARIGYVNPDQTTIEYLEGREYAPTGEAFERAKAYWLSVRSDDDAVYDDVVVIDGSKLAPMVTWGINPGQALSVEDTLPDPDAMNDEYAQTARDAYSHMKLTPGAPIAGTSIDMAFIGSCTNSRISDLREAAVVFKGRRVSSDVTVLVVPGSQQVKEQAEREGLDVIFKDAGCEWREAGCSMCLAMNTDRLFGDQVCASSSNRNFIGRQGSPKGRTLLMSPAMVAAAAIEGHVVDARAYLNS